MDYKLISWEEVRHTHPDAYYAFSEVTKGYDLAGAEPDPSDWDPYITPQGQLGAMCPTQQSAGVVWTGEMWVDPNDA